MKNLVIVESPTKARTISRFLGDDFVIKFSMGHIMDLPKSTLGVDVDHDFKPELQVISDKKKLFQNLRLLPKVQIVLYWQQTLTVRGSNRCKHQRSFN